MTTFLVLYRSTVSAAEQMANADSSADSVQAWIDWATGAGDALIDLGSPTQSVAGTEAESFISGYSLMQADSLDALQRLLQDHPHQAWGGTIEVLELLQIPGM